MQEGIGNSWGLSKDPWGGGPPAEESAPIEAEPEQDSAVLADDGYQYKTVRRLKYRNRRDVSELSGYQYETPEVKEVPSPAPEYLPPVKESAPVEDEPEQDTAVLADDGYQYKTVRRLKYRQRRDVSEIAAAAPEYLPPAEESAPLEAEPEQDSAVLADDGYQYKTVPEEYLPPQQEAAEPEQDSAILADDGYQYKQIKKLKYRHRA
uniref:Fibrous sheath CABYR-binding protein n=1 Tax=Megaselia scalaris TaxID=36166 RepID=T1GHE0_MEGSC